MEIRKYKKRKFPYNPNKRKFISYPVEHKCKPDYVFGKPAKVPCDCKGCIAASKLITKLRVTNPKC